jgi:hypothetical protein
MLYTVMGRRACSLTFQTLNCRTLLQLRLRKRAAPFDRIRRGGTQCKIALRRYNPFCKAF